MTKTHKQANLYVETHEMLDKIVSKINEQNSKPGRKASKASLVHNLVERHYKRVMKDDD